MQTEIVQWVAITTTRNRLGDGTEAEASPVPVEATVSDAGSSESDDPDDPQVIIRKKLHLLGVAADPGPSDRFIVRGHTYDVDGEPHRWGSMGVELVIARTEVRR